MKHILYIEVGIWVFLFSLSLKDKADLLDVTT